jgi:methylphosphotriester-DNA--protein-cysteine methyltransferase
MIRHWDLGEGKFTRSRNLKRLINEGKISFGGNIKLKIYGLMKCGQGKRLKIRNRVFFSSESEAIDSGFRPCGACMRKAYLAWKAGSQTPPKVENEVAFPAYKLTE